MKSAKNISVSVASGHYGKDGIGVFFGNPKKDFKRKHELSGLAKMSVFTDNKRFGHSIVCQTLRPYFNRL